MPVRTIATPPMPDRLPAIPVFVATRRDQVPPECARFVSVDGSVPGAMVTWNHHVTGELVNLDAMPRIIDVAAFDGIGTTMADSDAVASAIAVLLGGLDAIPIPAAGTLLCASHWCDHLGPHPAYSEEVNRAGRGLHGFILAAISRAASQEARSRAFDSAARGVASCILTGSPLPFDTTILDDAARVACAIDADGRIDRRGVVAVIDLRGAEPTSPDAFYAIFDCSVGVFVEEHAGGGTRYTVGLNPRNRSGPQSVRPLLAALAAAEFAHGPPALGPSAAPGMENWGGRDTVGGSPWNYGSRLSVEEVTEIAERVLR